MSLNFSIIIPVKSINKYIRETINHILRIKNNNWEILILPNADTPDEWKNERIKIIPTGGVSPARKRDIGALNSSAEILVFLDDDSYPELNILEIANEYFSDETIVALCGPGITPREDSFWQKVSGSVFLSKFSGGFPERYLSIGNPKPVDDWPSVNLMVRREDFIKIDGFDNDFWPGEDTKFCLKLIQKTKKTLLYVPSMVVWHHRRKGLLRHLQQIGSYAKHRGFFARKFPMNSRKPMYFVPSIFSIFVLSSLFIPIIALNFIPLLILGWLLYLIALVKAWVDIRIHENTQIATVALGYIPLTHFWYGIQFIIGFFTPNLKSKLR